MQICYNTVVWRATARPHRSGTGADCLLCPPRGRITNLHNGKHDVPQKYWSYFMNKNYMLASCAPLSGRLTRFCVFLLGLTRASAEHMGKGKRVPFACQVEKNAGVNALRK